MERFRLVVLAMLAGSIVLSGCASGPPHRGSDGVSSLVAARGLPDLTWARGDAARLPSPTGPVSRAEALKLAFANNPQVRELYARLGIASADVVEASRLANPRLGYVDLSPEGGGLSQITRSISLDFANALLLPSRARLARTEFQRSQELVADGLLDLSARVERAWFEAVSARQVAELRELATTASSASGEMAQRLYDAGNLSPKAFALESAAASEQRVAAARAKADATRAREALAQLMGLSTREAWQVPNRLPAVKESAGAPLDESALMKVAEMQRLDLSAARREVAHEQDLAGTTRRWRWLGDVEAGYERESDTDGSRLRGPSLSLRLPIFNQNQSGVMRADAQAEMAQARLSDLELRVKNEVARNLDELASAREIAEAYRTAVLPQREQLVNSTQEEHNYMLIGVFELLQARRSQLDAYQSYVEAVRDYWLARTDLRESVGGALPGESPSDADEPMSEGAEAPVGGGAEHEHHGDAQ
jgi:cobalt-zinc-cadmium efflux system outer membrane protein